MEIIGEDKIISFRDSGKLKEMNCFEVRKGQGCIVNNYMDLATKIASLQFKNQAHVLLFRGQGSDYKRINKKLTRYTTLAPSLFRGSQGAAPNSQQLVDRFQVLKNAELRLVSAYERKRLPDIERLKRQRLLRWSILQHYEVCPTPLLDVTHSLRIAVSFACDRDGEDAFIFVLGVPNISGAMTVSAETGLQIVRLASVCPPQAVRPHIQEGYLLGEYPEMVEYDQKALYRHYEIDFGRRLIAKFRFRPADFKGDENFPMVSRAALYPDKKDPLFKLAKSIKL